MHDPAALPEPTRAAAAAGRHLRTRWRVFACVFAFGFLGYVQRTGVAVAAEHMLPELGLTKTQFGWLLNAFLMSYTFCQLPGALVGQHLGARRALALIGLVTAAAAMASAAVPAGPASLLVLVVVFAARLCLGIAQSALFPVASGVIESWFPVRRWGLAQGLTVTGLWLGSASTPPLIAWLMSGWGWRTALVASSLPTLALVLLWVAYARDRPAEHPGVTAAELAELAGNPPPVERRIGVADVWRLLRDRRIALVTLSYFLMNYVFYLVTFWCFVYLVEERRFALLEGGVFASLPFLAAAAAAGLGGRACDQLCERLGTRRGLRVLPLVALPATGLFLLLTGAVTSAYAAVAMLCLAFACNELTEGTYWAATMRVAPTEVMAGTALLNTGGNLGGVIATPTIAALATDHRWTLIFALGAGLSVLAAVLWLAVSVDDERRGAATA
ncbi:MAG: MFS transporter [Proteobacteria bacterium]|nr:MFS transporter [Pseudomonadota bacterium]